MICSFALGIWLVPKIFPKFFDAWLSGKTGFSTTMHKVDLKIFSSNIGIDDIKISNPPYYQNRNFVKLNKLSLKVQPTSWFKDTLIVDHLHLDIDKITLVYTSEKMLNVYEFYHELDKGFKNQTPSVTVETNEKATPSVGTKKLGGFFNAPNDFIVKKLVIKIGVVEVIGFPTSEVPPKTFLINYNKEFYDVSDFEALSEKIKNDLEKYGIDIIRDVILDHITKKAVKGAKNAFVEKFGDKVTDVSEDIEKAVGKGVKKIFDSLKKL